MAPTTSSSPASTTNFNITHPRSLNPTEPHDPGVPPATRRRLPQKKKGKPQHQAVLIGYIFVDQLRTSSQGERCATRCAFCSRTSTSGTSACSPLVSHLHKTWSGESLGSATLQVQSAGKSLQQGKYIILALVRNEKFPRIVILSEKHRLSMIYS